MKRVTIAQWALCGIIIRAIALIFADVFNVEPSPPWEGILKCLLVTGLFASFGWFWRKFG